MSDDKTHNIHTWLAGHDLRPTIESAIEMVRLRNPSALENAVRFWARGAAEDSDDAFTADQCAEVIKTWPCYTGEKEK